MLSFSYTLLLILCLLPPLGQLSPLQSSPGLSLSILLVYLFRETLIGGFFCHLSAYSHDLFFPNLFPYSPTHSHFHLIHTDSDPWWSPCKFHSFSKSPWIALHIRSFPPMSPYLVCHQKLFLPLWTQPFSSISTLSIQAWVRLLFQRET